MRPRTSTSFAWLGRRFRNHVAEKLPAVAEPIDGARADILACTDFPNDTWVQIWSNHGHSHNCTREIISCLLMPIRLESLRRQSHSSLQKQITD